LVTALKKWGQQLKFTSCEYEYGQLNIDHSDQVEPADIPYTELMKEHIKKEERYQKILPSISDIETKRREICKEIEKIMSYPTSIAPYQPSFEKIIIDKITLMCPTLNRSRDVELRKNNIYLDTYIFKLIFNTISMNISTIPLTLQPTYNTNIWQLAYQNGIIILAQGEKAAMYTLKEAIEHLVVDKNIKERVEDYYDYHKQLTNDEEIEALKNAIQNLYDYTYGGQPLGGYPACELCGPFNVSPNL
jgi:hypothetical protein